MFNLASDTYLVVFYNEIGLLTKLERNHIFIRNFEKIAPYKYTFKTSLFNRKKIKKNFKDIKIIKKEGVLNYLFSLFNKKTTLFSLILASLLLYDVSQRIWGIEISGDYQVIEEEIYDQLILNGLELKSYVPSSSSLKKVETNVYNFLIKDIEWLEIRNNGSKINVRYQKRRKVPTLPSKKSNLYATKDGVIKYFNIQSGLKKVKENQFVKKGDLLVSDVMEDTSGNLVNIGTLGEVYANTFYMIEVSKIYEYEMEESEIFADLLFLSKIEISKHLSKGEKIEKEMIIKQDINQKSGTLKVYYVLLEDITI